MTQESYSGLRNVKVEALRLDESHLNTKRMLELMAFDKTQPLYAQVIQRILRDMRLKQQEKGGIFNYKTFKQTLHRETLMSEQSKALKQRLDTLESFLVQDQVRSTGSTEGGTDWTLEVSQNLITLLRRNLLAFFFFFFLLSFLFLIIIILTLSFPLPRPANSSLSI
jgi:hypothetical protein